MPQFYEYGNGSVFQVAADANGVTYSPTTPVATPGGSSSSSSSGSVTSSPSGAVELRILPAHFAASLAVVGGLVLGASSLF